jgi:ribosomal protein S18 acetylase RimI-like enzyme
MNGTSHPLDRPIWSALTSQHRRFALGGPLAIRYPAAVAGFAALAEPSPEAFQALRKLMAVGETVALVQVDPVAAPPEFETLLARPLDQMAGGAISAPCEPLELLPMGPADVPEMMELVTLTKPGPFAQRTLEMGDYLGVREAGRLVAMAGERMRIEGFTEISAICTHPDWRGRGLARALIIRLVAAVTARGERPFLHVLGENAAAIALYRELGFSKRQTLHYTILRRAR